MQDPEFLEAAAPGGAAQAVATPTSTRVEYAEFVETFGRARDARATCRYAFFVEGGALGVENALKAAFDWKVRRNQAQGDPRREGARRCSTSARPSTAARGYTLSLTNTDPRKTEYFPKFDWPRVDNPKPALPGRRPRSSATWPRPSSARSTQIERAFAEHPDDIAAIIIEPIQAEGGDNHFRPEFLHALQRDGATSTTCFFIFDEVQTGVGITGKMWAHEHFGVRPDALAFGKKTQVCGCLVGPRVDEEPDNVFKVSSRINSTWGGNLIDMVRCARYLEIIDEDGLVENARVVGEHLLAGLRELAARVGRQDVERARAAA